MTLDERIASELRRHTPRVDEHMAWERIESAAIARRRQRVPIAFAAVSAAALVLVLVGLVLVNVGGNQEVVDDPTPTVTVTQPAPTTPETQSAPTRVTPVPDFEGAVAGDDGTGPLPLGAVNELPGDDYLDFLYEECDWPGVEGCFRDAHFMSPDNPPQGVWTAERPFHIRDGFINNGDEPLGDGFDLVVYVTPMNDPSEFGGVPTGGTVRYTSDYVLRGTSDQCGPTYKSQTEPVTCEWFVHDFPEGLPEGRYAMWAVWEAPCRAWVDLGLTDSCADPDGIMTLFSSGFDFPNYLIDLDGSAGPLERPPVDGSGSAPTRVTPVPDFEGAVAGDDGTGPLPLGAVNELPGDDYLDFLYEECDWPGVEGCFRDAHFMSPDNPPQGVWTAERPFHIRDGFINNGDEPLGDGFDLVVYVTPMNDPSEFGGVPTGGTVRYTSDYVLRGTSDQCGPTYKSQTEPVTCEWFVHDFPEGLPEGRYAMWAVWEAPCRAWVDLGLTDSCADPDGIMTLFSSGFDFPNYPKGSG